MTSKIYDNCEIYRSNDTFFCFCSKRKMNWYLEKELAEKIEGHDAIKLKFDPQFRDENDKYVVYMRTKLNNKCFTCDITEGLVKYRIIPSEYLKFIPVECKCRNPDLVTNIISLCIDCRNEADSHAQELKDKLCEEFNVCSDYYIDHDRIETKSLCRKILKCRKKGFDDRVLMERLSLKFNRRLDDELYEHSNCDISAVYKNTRSPAEYIVLQIIHENKIEDFIKQWKDILTKVKDSTSYLSNDDI